jgi:hypothetical protein
MHPIETSRKLKVSKCSSLFGATSVRKIYVIKLHFLNLKKLAVENVLAYFDAAKMRKKESQITLTLG